MRIDREKLKRLHAAGLTDREIAGRLGCHRDAVSKIRHGMGLPHNWDAMKRRESAQMALRRWVRISGMGSLSEIRWAGQRIAGMCGGYPPDLGSAECRVLMALLALGGSGTRREILERAGRSSVSIRPHGHGPTTVLGSLRIKGYVTMSGGARSSRWHVTDKLDQWRAGRSRAQRGGALLKMVS